MNHTINVPDGKDEGTRLGASDGTRLGASLGASLGTSLGARLGASDGDRLGASDPVANLSATLTSTLVHMSTPCPDTKLVAQSCRATIKRVFLMVEPYIADYQIRMCEGEKW